VAVAPSRGGRIPQFRDSIVAFARGLSWNSLHPLEERLAGEAVRKSGLFFLSPLVVLASAGASWWLFPLQEGTDRLGLFYGTVSIVLMAWTFLLATRARVFEILFGGFDRLHVWHRWVGIVSIVFLLLHSSAGNSVRSGTVPFGRGVEETALSLAELAQTLLIILIVVSILRILPYRIWKFSHLLIFVPFAFSAFHVVTAERPFEQFSMGGLWLWLWSAVGLGAFLYRLIAVDSGIFDSRANIASTVSASGLVSIELRRRDGAPWNRIVPGQFIYLRWGGLWSEAHPFSVVSTSEDATHIGVRIRVTGDGTRRAPSLRESEEVMVSRAHGHLDLGGGTLRAVWIAGGSGITPFLQSSAFLRRFSQPPTVVYFFRGVNQAIELSYLRRMANDRSITLVEVDTSAKQGRNSAFLAEVITGGEEVAVCGPRSLVLAVMKQARRVGSARVSFELYDYRSPFGPDLSPVFRALTTFLLPAAIVKRLGWLFGEASDSRPKALMDSPVP
jgi:predicted ferric reductase